MSKVNPELGDIVVSRNDKAPISAIIEGIQTLPTYRVIIRSIRDNRIYQLPFSALGVTWDIVT